MNEKETKLNPVYALKEYSFLDHHSYQVKEVLGEGGFGITYKGRNRVGTIVAIKECFPQGEVTRDNQNGNAITWHTDHTQYTEDLLAEARRVAQITDCPLIAPVRDAFFDNNTAYVVMDYVKGVTLREYIRQKGKMAFSDCIRMLAPLMEELNRIHQDYHLIHRDISPSNIMVQEDETVRLLDFGAAKVIEGALEKGATVSRPFSKDNYSPHEQQIEHGKVGPWSDVYAMCATILFCITGKPPVPVIERFEDPKLHLPNDILEPISPKSNSILEKGMAISYEKRYQTMDDLLTALKKELKWVWLEKAKDAIAGDDELTKKGTSFNDKTPEFQPKGFGYFFHKFLLGFVKGFKYFFHKWFPGLTREVDLVMNPSAFGFDETTNSEEKESVTPSAVPVEKKPLTPSAVPVEKKPLTPSAVPVEKKPITPSAVPVEKKPLTPSVAPVEKNPVISSGDVTDTIKWSFRKDGTLELTGNGDLPGYDNTEWFYENKLLNDRLQHRSVFLKKIYPSDYIKNELCPIPWLQHIDEIKAIQISQGITDIGRYSFLSHCSLEQISLPSSVTSIGERAFSYCTSLTSMSIPNSVTSIGAKAFYQCSSLTSISISNSITSIGSWGLGGCSSLTTIAIPSSVTSIGGGAFGGCSSLTSIFIPDSVTSIGDRTFEECSSLTNITIPNSVTSIGWNAFDDCRSLTSISIPDSVTSICSGAFKNCRNLKVIEIPVSVKIGRGAFYGCPATITRRNP